ncbi:MAG: NAD-dependent epimerase/dehydratase family protein [Gemmobacter sp.]
MRLLVVGATGRVGRCLRAAWLAVPPAGITPVWQTRRAASAAGWVSWDPLSGAPMPACDGVLDLAGITPGSGADLGMNARLAAAVTDAAGGRRVLFASSVAVYGETGPAADERRPPRPTSPYGAAKLEAEAAVEGRAVILRIGNAIGADALQGAVAALAAGARQIVFDRFADGGGPRRSCIGPQTLARVLAALALAPHLPPVLNVASPGAVDLAAILRAAGVPFVWRPAHPGAVQHAVMDCTLLATLVPLPPADAACIAAEWRPAPSPVPGAAA